MTTTRCVVQASGGKGSWYSGVVAQQVFGKENTYFLFADTLIEDDDLYRFLIETWQALTGADMSAALAMVPSLPSANKETLQERKKHLAKMRMIVNSASPQVAWIAEGRSVWEVFMDVKFIGNTRIDPCSKILKRDFLRAYLEEHFDPEDTVIAIGIDWTEEHRYRAAIPRWEPWLLWAPLCDPPYYTKDHITEELAKAGIANPRLYEMGFPHNNCGGACVKAGQGNFKLLLEKRPEVYLEWAERELEFRKANDKDVAILRSRKQIEVPYDGHDHAYVAGEWIEDSDDPDGVIEGCLVEGCEDGPHPSPGDMVKVPNTRPLPLFELADQVACNIDNTDPFDLSGCGCVA